MQTQRRSMLETCCNVLSGIVTACLVWQFIVIPWALIIGINMNCMGWTAVLITNSAFTIVSVVRGFFWRRWFNRGDE